MSDQTANDFLLGGGDTYDEVPSGDFAPLSNIGKAKTSQGWKVFVDVDLPHEGEYPSLPNPLPRGFYFLPGNRDEAQAFAKKYLGREFVSRHIVTNMPVASITNMTNDAREKFTSPYISADCRVVGLPKDYTNPDRKHGHGLNLILIPSLVDAYARMKGWYKDSLFAVPSSLVPGDATTVSADIPAEVFEKLVEQRNAIWAALGEKPSLWAENKTDKLTSAKLIEAIKRLVNSSWEAWVKMTTVYDPSPGAYYTKADGAGDMKAHRNRVQVILEFFPNERAAVEAGQKELAARSQTTESTNGTLVSDALFSKLSKKAQEAYKNAATLGSVVADILGDSRPAALVAKDFDLTAEDVNLLKA